MNVQHTVVQGEHLTRIAIERGFTDVRKIWASTDNAQLKARRDNINVLMPGDTVVVPERTPKQETGATEQQHRFRIRGRNIELNLAIQKCFGVPVDDRPCHLVVEGRIFDLRTDEDGRISQIIPKTAQDAKLVIGDEQVVIQIGHLDPVAEVSGQIGRLDNLGYNPGPVDGVDKEQFLSALEEFQCDHGLTVDGLCGPKTQSKLKEVHGC